MFRLPVTLSSSTLRRLGVVAAACAAVLATSVSVTACGGGTQSKKFVPSRVVSFGDENSYLSSTGRKYTVNDVNLDSSGAAYELNGATTTTTTTDPTKMEYNCGNNPIWVQLVAANFGFDSDQCPVSGASRNAFLLANDPTTVSTDVTGAISAANAATAVSNAGVDAVIGKMTAAANNGLINNGTLVLLMAGQPDVLKAYSDYLATPTTDNLSALKSQLDTLGIRLADAVKQFYTIGARTVIVRMPRLSLSPLGVNAGTANQTVLNDLTYTFNEALTNRAQANNFDGRLVALARADDLTTTLVTSPSSYSLTDWTTTACITSSTMALTAPLCDNSYQTAVTNTNGSTSSTAYTDHLWSDATHYSPAGHSRLASLVIARIAANPF
jgi:outer membrane lipase/esterase